MNTLIETLSGLTEVTHAHPRLLLANTVAWLDPVGPVDELDEPQYDHGMGIYALAVVRKVFPDIYAKALEMMEHFSLDHITAEICTEITQKGIPVDGIEFLMYGIPIPAYGFDTDLSIYPNLHPVLQALGLDPEEGEEILTTPFFVACSRLAESLQEIEAADWKNVYLFMRWVTSDSGNTTVDYAFEEMDFNPLSWLIPEEVQLAIEIITEANSIMESVSKGIAFLNNNEQAMEAFTRNFKFAQATFLKGEEANGITELELDWPEISSSAQ